jgi:hypothetical protein
MKCEKKQGESESGSTAVRAGPKGIDRAAFAMGRFEGLMDNTSKA